MVKPRLNRDLSLIKPIKPLAAAVVPIRGILSKAETDTREPLSKVFSLVAGGRVKIQKRGSCEVTTGT
jgi:hypothetical protein